MWMMPSAPTSLTAEVDVDTNEPSPANASVLLALALPTCTSAAPPLPSVLPAVVASAVTRSRPACACASPAATVAGPSAIVSPLICAVASTVSGLLACAVSGYGGGKLGIAQ